MRLKAVFLTISSLAFSPMLTSCGDTKITAAEAISVDGVLQVESSPRGDILFIHGNNRYVFGEDPALMTVGGTYMLGFNTQTGSVTRVLKDNFIYNVDDNAVEYASQVNVDVYDFATDTITVTGINAGPYHVKKGYMQRDPTDADKAFLKMAHKALPFFLEYCDQKGIALSDRAKGAINAESDAGHFTP